MGIFCQKENMGIRSGVLKRLRLLFIKKKKEINFFFWSTEKKRLSLPRLYSVKLDDIWQKSWKIRNIIIITSHG